MKILTVLRSIFIFGLIYFQRVKTINTEFFYFIFPFPFNDVENLHDIVNRPCDYVWHIIHGI